MGECLTRTRLTTAAGYVLRVHCEQPVSLHNLFACVVTAGDEGKGLCKYMGLLICRGVCQPASGLLGGGGKGSGMGQV